LGLFTENFVAIDGSKFKAVNHRDRNFANAKLKRRMEEIESSIAHYLKAWIQLIGRSPSLQGPKAVWKRKSPNWRSR
jgi:hypothetical protein